MATTAGESIFVDTNVVVHARNADSPDHEAAASRLYALAAAGAELWVSRQVLREFAVIVSRQMMVQNVYAADVLAGELDRLEREYVVADEDADVTRHWKQLIQTYEVKGKTIHDANIVATMLAFGVNRVEVTGLRLSPLPHHPACGSAPGGSNQTNG